MSLEDLLRLGQSARPWDFLPLGVMALGQIDRADLRRLVAASGVRLGLLTVALEALDGVGEATGEDVALRDAAAGLPCDVIPLSRRRSILRANLDAVLERGSAGILGADEEDFEGHLAAWEADAAKTQCLLARDGNIARRRRSAGGGWTWISLGDDVGEAQRLRLPHTPGGCVNDAGAPPPYVLEGIDPPWLFRRVMETTPAAADGFHPRVTIVQAAWSEFLDGLSLVDLRPMLREERVQCCVGPMAGQRLRSLLEGRLHTAIKGVCISMAGASRKVTPTVSAIVEDVVAAQAAEHVRLTEQVKAIYAGRTAAWWGDRYERARGGGDEAKPLRVLVPVSRYSTFVRHSAEDLVEAFANAGMEARCITEPDVHSRLSSLAYLRQFAEFRPDLVVLINFTRLHMGAAIPANVPFVCWIQDAMQQLYDARVGAGQGELDFVVGNAAPELFTQFGYPKARSFRMPVAASSRKFHPAPVAQELRRRFECEMSYVSHHSESPEALHVRQLEAFRGQPAVQRALDEAMPRVRAIAEDPMRGGARSGVQGDMQLEVRTALRAALGAALDERLVTVVLKQWAMPLADRIIRHHTLGWAAEIAERRGWRLRLYGRGWLRHPRFAAWAQPESAHGEELRAIYQSSAVSMHMSINMLSHQRVLECALSGGLPACRLHADEVMATEASIMKASAARACPDLCALKGKMLGLRVADRPELLSMMMHRERLDLPASHIAWISPALAALCEADGVSGSEQLLATIVDDLSLTTFSHAAGLERLVEQAAEHAAWREAVGTLMRRRIGDGFTHDVFVARLLRLIQSHLVSHTRGACRGQEAVA